LRVVIYGAACAKCQSVVQTVRDVIDEQGLDVELEKVTDLVAIAAAGVLGTPAVAIDGKVKVAGRVPARSEVATWFAEAQP
jgi:small redox-active disulfide protein 2